MLFLAAVASSVPSAIAATAYVTPVLISKLSIGLAVLLLVVYATFAVTLYLLPPAMS
jgi:hypothetical protein